MLPNLIDASIGWSQLGWEYECVCIGAANRAVLQLCPLQFVLRCKLNHVWMCAGAFLSELPVRAACVSYNRLKQVASVHLQQCL